MNAARLGWLAALLVAAMPLRSSPAGPPAATIESISARFWSDVAEPECGNAPRRWLVHYADVPRRLRNPREARLRADVARVPAGKTGRTRSVVLASMAGTFHSTS